MTALESSNRLLSVADSGSPNLPKFMGTGRQIPETCLQLAYNSPTTGLTYGRKTSVQPVEFSRNFTTMMLQVSLAFSGNCKDCFQILADD